MTMNHQHPQLPHHSQKSLATASTISIPSCSESFEDFSRRLINEYSLYTVDCSWRCGKQQRYTKAHCSLPRLSKILTASEDKSAEISFVLRTFNLWHDEDFWKKINLEEVMRFYARNEKFREPKLKNFFSLLMFDWCDASFQKERLHHLRLKFAAFAKVSPVNLFQRLYDVVNDESLQAYHHVCLILIYYYLYEVERIEGEWSEEFRINRLGAIDDVLNFRLKNFDYQIEVLKILVVHWNVDFWRINQHMTSAMEKRTVYEHYKAAILNLFTFKLNYNYTTTAIYPTTVYTWPGNFKLDCDRFFFRLAFSLKEMLPKRFESDFERYVRFFQDGFGEYWKTAIKPDVHLLLRIADGLELFKTVEFMFKQCPFIALNWNILMSFEEIGEFYEVTNEPLRRMERLKMNTIHREFRKIDQALTQNLKTIQNDSEIFQSAENLSPSPSRDFKFFEEQKFLPRNHSFDGYETADSADADIEMRSFDVVSKSEIKARENLNIASKMKTKVLKSVLKNTRSDRRVLFGRRSAGELSLFEEMLQTSRGSSFVNYVWNDFKLWEVPDVLIMVNPLGKTLLHYAIESRDDLNLMTFLLPQVMHKSEFKRHKHYMKTLNNLFHSITNKTLLEFYLEVSMDDRSCEYDQEDYQVILCKHIVHLLEEYGTIAKVQKDPLIDRLIALAEDENFYEKIARPHSEFRIHSKSERRKEKFHIDDLLGRMIVYWKPSGDEKVKGNFYPHYKKRLCKISQFFELVFNVIEHRSKSFKNNYRAKIHKLEQCYERRYSDICNSEYHTSSFNFVMLLAAIHTNQRNVIDFIFAQDIFETIRFDFPSNMRTQEIHYYTTLMLLRNGHELGKCAIPHEWVTPAVLYEFFDSQISYFNQDLVEINVGGLLHSETRKTVVKTARDVTEKMMLWDDDRTLRYLLEHKNVRHIIAHPAVSTFIELKYAKHKMIFRLNFWFFVLYFVLPFSLFVFFNSETLPAGLYPLCITSIAIFIGKELFQLQMAKSARVYLRDLTNKIDLPLIVLSALLLVSCAGDWHPQLQALIEVIFIFVMTWDAMTMLPVEAVSRTLQIIKRVTRTFVRVFCSFALIILAFAFSFRILFGTAELARGNGTSVEETPEREPNVRNFEGIHTTFVKVLVMMAGEYAIEPSTLHWYQLALFGVFVVFSFILFNLLLGMSIEDIQNLRAAAQERDLKMKAKKFIETNDKFEEIYAERTFTNTKYISISSKLIYRVSKFFLSEYVYLHNFRKIYINLKTREVTVSVNEKQEPIMKRRIPWLTTRYYINQEVFEKIEDIISLRDQENCLNIVKRH